MSSVSANQTPSRVERAVLPSISYNPAIGLAVGGVLSVATRRGSDDAPLSSLQATAAFTTQKQIITALRTDLPTRSRGKAASRRPGGRPCHTPQLPP